MDKSALMRWWRYELRCTLCGGCNCETCQLYVTVVTEQLPAEKAVYEPILRLCFLPGTRWRTARQWIKDGCPDDAITTGDGWEIQGTEIVERTQSERGVA